MKTQPSIEPLEARIAPASAFVTYTDIDGDLVKITASAPAGTPPLDAADLLLSNGPGNPGQLRSLNLLAADFQGASITFAVTKAAGGDGLAHVGRIDAAGVDLGVVTVKGDLGEINCGDGVLTDAALKLLSVRSMGRFGTATGAADLTSTINGALGDLKVTNDVKEVFIDVTGGNESDLGSVTIGGSLIGGSVPTNRSGTIYVSGDMGPVKVGGDIVGGAGPVSASINADNIASLSVGGSLLGGTGDSSARIITGDLGPVKIGRDIGWGGGGSSASINASGTFTSLTVGGSVLGIGSFITGENIGPVRIAGDFSGFLTGDLSVGGITIGGSVFDALISTQPPVAGFGDIGAVKIAGDFVDSFLTAQSGGTLASVTIGGAFIGEGDANGMIYGSNIGAVKIGGNVIGDGDESAQISGGAIASVTIGGSLLGGTGMRSAYINAQGELGPVNIRGNVLGGAGEDAGYINAGGGIASLTIGGSVVGGTANRTGGITAGGDIGAVIIGRDLRGGSIGAGAGNLDRSGHIEGDRIASVTIGGSIVAGLDTSDAGFLLRNASIRAFDDIGAVTVKGGIVGNATSLSSPVLQARGQETLAPGAATDIAIKSVTVGGHVEWTTILAGFDPHSPPTAGQNGNASIGAVKVGGDWIASSISAGVNDTNGNGFGNDDQRIGGATLVSRIASITIKGVVAGTSVNTDHFGFTAAQVGSLKSLGFTAALTDAPAQLFFLSPITTGDVTIREV